MVAEISDWFVRDSSVVYDLGTSIGEGIHRIYERHPKKRLQFIAVDSSREMIQQAKEKLSHVPNVDFVVCDLNKPFPVKNASMVMSILTLHFLQPSSRPRLLKEIYDGLRGEGAFILVEKVLGSTPRFDEMWVDMHHDMKRRSGLSDEEIALKRRSLRAVMLPYSVRANMRLIREAGFPAADLFFKWYNWAGILAVK